MNHKNTAFLLIDIQNGFMPNGELPVSGGDEIIPIINQSIYDYPLVIASQDWHPQNHVGFAVNHKAKEPFDVIEWQGIEQILWPTHCVQGSNSAAFHPDLNTNPIAAIFRKGMHPDIDSYSAFYDNNHRNNTGLASYLRAHNITNIHIAGLAADYCVYYSIIDALLEGFYVGLMLSATRAIDPIQHQRQLQSLNQNDHFYIIS